MTTYTKELQNLFPEAIISQFGNRQMAVVTHSNYTRLLYSYRTIVGRFRNGVWYLTTTKYSHTTTRQLNQFVHTVGKVEWVDDIDNIRN
jgi:hypothetical protein